MYNVHCFFVVILARIRAFDIIPVEQVIWFNLCARISVYVHACVRTYFYTYGCYHICFDLENKYFMKQILHSFLRSYLLPLVTVLVNGFLFNLEKYTDILVHPNKSALEIEKR